MGAGQHLLDDLGQHMTVIPWERNAALAMEDHRVVAVSAARCNGMTEFAAGVARSAIDQSGALFFASGHVVLVGPDFSSVTDLFRRTLHYLQPDGSEYRVIHNNHQMSIEHRATRTRLDAFGSGQVNKTLGMSPTLVIADAPSSWQGKAEGHEMVARLKAGMYRHTTPLFVALGTRGDAEDGWFTNLSMAGEGIYIADYHANRHDDEFHEATWRKANPSFHALPGLRAMIEEEAENARHDKMSWRKFLAQHLNMPTWEIEAKERMAAAKRRGRPKATASPGRVA